MTKVDIISGFLGAGKTTLIKKLLKEALSGEKIVLIENEFGEIGIDGGFMKDAGIEITEMNSGCICCSLVGDFGKALKEVVTKYAPDRIIIEPSGVGKLSDVTRAVANVAEGTGLVINSMTTVADASKCKMYSKNFGEFYNNQIESAGTIVLSRTQKLTQEKLDACIEQIKKHNPNAAIVTTNWDDISGAQILAAMEKTNDMIKELMEAEDICPECGCHHDHDHEHEHHHHDHDHEHEHHHEHEHDHEHEHHHEHEHEHDHDHHHHHHHADEVFTSMGGETAKKFTKEEVGHILAELDNTAEYGVILRAKGILPAADGSWIHFDYVPEEQSVRSGAADYTGRYCVIGTKLCEDKINSLFSK